MPGFQDVQPNIRVAGKQGFEPRFHDPESCVHADLSFVTKLSQKAPKIAKFYV